MKRHCIYSPRIPDKPFVSLLCTVIDGTNHVTLNTTRSLPLRFFFPTLGTPEVRRNTDVGAANSWRPALQWPFAWPHATFPGNLQGSGSVDGLTERPQLHGGQTIENENKNKHYLITCRIVPNSLQQSSLKLSLTGFNFPPCVVGLTLDVKFSLELAYVKYSKWNSYSLRLSSFKKPFQS